MSKIRWKISNLKFLGSLGPLIHRTLLAKSISQLPECPNQLAYFTIISFLVSNLSFSVKKSKISQLETKLWPPEVEVKKILELQSVKICKKSFFCTIFIKTPVKKTCFHLFLNIFLTFQISPDFSLEQQPYKAMLL